MAVLKILVSAALLGTVARCQDAYNPYRSGTSGAQYAQYSPSVLTRGTPRLVPVKVRASASRLFPSFYYPAYPPPPLPSLFSRHQALNHRPYSSSSGTTPGNSGIHQSPTFPRLHQQYRPAMTGYYRPTRQSYFGNPYRESQQQQLTYQAAAATSAPIVLKRGRVLSASSSSPYAIQSLGSPGGLSYPYTQSIPAVSTYRPPPPAQPAPQPQISASPIDHSALFQQHIQQLQLQQSLQQQQKQQQQQQPQIQHQPQQVYQPQIQHQIQPQIQQQTPAYYLQKSPGPVVAGPLGRPLKKVKKPLPRPTAETEEAEEEYPGDPNPQYNFSFDIKDDELTNYQNRQEERDGQTIKGSYSVVDPDGYVRTVTYTADPKNGFQAKVTREPTDVKIKFPVPTEAPPSDKNVLNSAGPARRVPNYASPQAQYQPQYQTAAYATPQQVYTSTAGEAGVVQPQYTQRAASRFAIQPQASAPQPRIVSRTSYTQTRQQSQEQEQAEQQ